MENKYKNIAVVFGGVHYNTIGIIRSLGEKGVPVFAIVNGYKKNYIEYSKYVKRSWSLPEIDDDITKVFDMISKSSEYKPVVFPTSDFAVSYIARNYDILKKKFIVSYINDLENNLVQNMDKKFMASKAEENGFNIPKSCLIDVEKFDNSLSHLKMPVIIKPSESISGKKTDIKVAYTIEELNNYLLDLKKNYKFLLAQEYIEGEDFVVYGCRMLSGKVYIPGYCDKIRQFPDKFGGSTYISITKKRYGVTETKISNYIRSIDYYGPFDLDFRFDGNKSFFIEINFRNGACNYLYTKSGANVPFAWYCDAVGIDYSVTDARINEKMIYEERDWRHLFNGNVSIFQWLYQLLSVKCFSLVNLKDPWCFIVRLLNKFVFRRK